MPDLIAAIEQGDGQLVRQLLATAQQQNGAAAELISQPADASGATALHIAAASGHEDIVKQLLEGGAAANVQDQRWDTALHAAGETSPCTLLIQNLHSQLCNPSTS